MPSYPMRYAPFSGAIAGLLIGCGAASPAPSSIPISTSSTTTSPTNPGESAVPPRGRAADLPVLAQWIVCERMGSSTRWLLVAGTVKRGAEEDPPADADYVVLREVDETFASGSRLPVHTISVPQTYALPQPFTVSVRIESEPPGARIYEVTSGGALVSLGTSPVDVTYAGTASALKVKLAGATWLTPEVGADGITTGLWAASDTMTAGNAMRVPLLTAEDLETLRHGTKRLSKRYTLPVHTPIVDANRVAIATAVVVNVAFLSAK